VRTQTTQRPEALHPQVMGHLHATLPKIAAEIDGAFVLLRVFGHFTWGCGPLSCDLEDLSCAFCFAVLAS
jgi:hypothetical protein